MQSLLATLPIATHVIVAWSVLSISKAVGQNAIWQGTRVIPSNIVLDGPGPPWKGYLRVGTPSSQRWCLLPNYFGPCFHNCRTVTVGWAAAWMRPATDDADLFGLIPLSHSYCLSLSLCLDWSGITGR